MIANKNHPKKGDITVVEPIRNKKDIRSIIDLLESQPRNQLLFVLGVNNGLRVGDILKLKVEDIKKLKPGDSMVIRESKTGKKNILVINKTVFKYLRKYLNQVRPKDEYYIFRSSKGDNKAITINYVNHLVKKWTSAINLEGNYGAHTLRKTWGYIQRVEFGIGFEVICQRFNHSSPATTMRYLGIEDKEITSMLMNEIGN